VVLKDLKVLKVLLVLRDGKGRKVRWGIQGLPDHRVYPVFLGLQVLLDGLPVFSLGPKLLAR
jgi:hypothetical protein